VDRLDRVVVLVRVGGLDGAEYRVNMQLLDILVGVDGLELVDRVEQVARLEILDQVVNQDGVDGQDGLA
jgi:hypothetical protein